MVVDETAAWSDRSVRSNVVTLAISFVSFVVWLLRAVGSLVPTQHQWIAVTVQVYIIAAWVCARELLAELLWPKTHRECVDALLESHFMKSRLVRIRAGTETALVTGADGTIGSQVVFLLIKLGFNVCALAGSAAKMRTVIENWAPVEKARVKVFQINFAEPLRMRTYLETLRERYEQFDVVVLAAGTMLSPDGPVHGFEQHAWVNVISQAAVLRAVEEKMADDARIVCLSSVCAHLALSSDLADAELLRSQRYGVYEAYARSKLHLAVYCEQLANCRRLRLSSLLPLLRLSPPRRHAPFDGQENRRPPPWRGSGRSLPAHEPTDEVAVGIGHPSAEIVGGGGDIRAAHGPERRRRFGRLLRGSREGPTETRSQPAASRGSIQGDRTSGGRSLRPRSAILVIQSKSIPTPFPPVLTLSISPPK
ncbi:hypothetical protein PENTCL1PPCAC_18930 [Pristionchus entomophagus]|uniref:Dehydrogenase n=1 Tax=Pristionchus entomophagus TaxID=358040 RepID=A0AAV5TQM6_9BILA|nr:hypothetical protein PENTCL1PPCAC_18930 [Pristionchus entomophagus]